MMINQSRCQRETRNGHISIEFSTYFYWWYAPHKSRILLSPWTFHFIRRSSSAPHFFYAILFLFFSFFFSYIYIYISLLFVLVWIFSKLENLDRRATRLGKLNLVRRWWNGIQLLVIRPGHDWKRMIESPKEREMTRGMGGWIIGMERWMRTDENSSCKINRGLNYWFSSN